jgi:hypothetical protein
VRHSQETPEKTENKTDHFSLTYAEFGAKSGGLASGVSWTYPPAPDTESRTISLMTASVRPALVCSHRGSLVGADHHLRVSAGVLLGHPAMLHVVAQVLRLQLR